MTVHRLQTQLANEIREYQREVYEKQQFLHDEDVRRQIDSLARLEIDRELDRQKFIERKQLEQHV